MSCHQVLPTLMTCRWMRSYDRHATTRTSSSPSSEHQIRHLVPSYPAPFTKAVGRGARSPVALQCTRRLHGERVAQDARGRSGARCAEDVCQQNVENAHPACKYCITRVVDCHVVVVVALVFVRQVRGEAGTDTGRCIPITDPVSLLSPPPVSTPPSLVLILPSFFTQSPVSVFLFS